MKGEWRNFFCVMGNRENRIGGVGGRAHNVFLSVFIYDREVIVLF